MVHEKLNSKEALSEAYSNLAVITMNQEDFDQAFDMIYKSIELKVDSEAHINLGNLLRQVDRK